MKYLHMTFHEGTHKNLTNIFQILGRINELDIEKYTLSYYISKDIANVNWIENENRWKNYDGIIVTDTSMLARPFLQNIDKHNIKIIIYITNRFNWGDWNLLDKEYYELYSRLSKHPNVIFLADNKYDNYWASLFGIQFYTPLTRNCPYIHNEIILPIHDKFFIYDRGTNINHYITNIENQEISYDIYGGKKYPRFRNQEHICEYKGIIHLPYQTNIMSLWENIGYYIIYFIPSQELIRQWILNEDWYYWEEKTKSQNVLLKSIELAEWYQEENNNIFVYFDSWEDLKQKIIHTNYIEKKRMIQNYIIRNNITYINQWNEIL